MTQQEVAKFLGVSGSIIGPSDAKQVHILDVLTTTFPEIQTKNWRAAMLKAFQGHEDFEGLQVAIERMDLLPDAFVIFKEEDEEGIIFFEVEVHSPMSGDKLRTYGKFLIDLAFYDVRFSVITVNKYGHANTIDLLPYYRDWLRMYVK
jgi:hypothetical protein